MAHSVNRRYRYGSFFIDEASGIRFEGHHPAQRPDLWKKYLDGAEGRYRSRGVEEAFHREELEAGTGVSLFFLGFDPSGNVVGGMRIHGPLENRFDAAIMGEMAASTEIGLIGQTIDKECRLGSIEVKGAWSDGQSKLGHRLLGIFERCTIHALNWLGAEFAVMAVADRMIFSGDLTAFIRIGETSVSFPDDRYRTVAISYRRALSTEIASPEQREALRRDAEQLSRGPGEVEIGDRENTALYQSWRPLVMDVRSRADREVLRTLREDSDLQLLDRFDEQVNQLSALPDAPMTEFRQEGQRWVYYPWRRALVRLMGPKTFDHLRLARNRHKITKREQNRLRSLKIGIVGVSAGHSIAHVLAMEGLAGELRLADFDQIELTNLNRIPTGVVDLGLNKALSAARRIAEIDPYLKVQTFTSGLTLENIDEFMEGLDLVVEECDSLDMKVLVREVARRKRLPVIMETSDRGVLDVERFDEEPDRPLFHGLVGDVDFKSLSDLSTEQKGPFVIRILGARDLSARGAASLLELGSTISGWPQLASEVTLGGASVATAVRRFGLGLPLPSGRVRIDLDEIVEALAPIIADSSVEVSMREPAPSDPRLDSGSEIEMILDAARRAPSGGNVQPWKFEVKGHAIHFYVLPERTSAMDIGHRGSLLGAGAAIFNARVAAARLRRLGSLQFFPSDDNPWHVATMVLGDRMDPEIEQLYDAIFTRSANRKNGFPQEIPDDILSHFRRASEKEGVNLRLTTDRDEILANATMLAEADQWRFLIPHVHGDMMSEVKIPGRDSLETGLDIRSLEMDESSLPLLELLQRADVMHYLSEWGGGKALGMRTRVAVASSSALALFTVPRSEPAWYLRAGAAVQRVWLLAEQAGLQVQPASPLYLFANDDDDMVNLAGVRKVEQLTAHGQSFRSLWQIGEYDPMAMVLRIFHSDPPTVRSIRLPLSEQVTKRNNNEADEDFLDNFQNYGA